ncbi:hypothetical protein K491DRAFT_686477 [Lophiostoma macrostomum CBS 122681]|uniref:Uncharacterized protein n=1 Tax=Lophiostoma macrostomum CBS 122681 TaxID=1314788 RepID=A0A6A6TTU1_9PLEO|nr:hypothetical protein K491DRAFT_686477 [Lophiostoma macrostomum CBS 122681]
MTASDKDAGGMISGTPVGTAESVFNNYPDDLTKWGYTFDTEAGEAFESGTGPEIDDAMRSLGIRYDEFDDDGPNYVTGWYHSKQTMHNNVVYPPTQARFRTIVNPEGGLIVGWLKYGLKFMGANLNPRVTQIPEFKNWADVAHLSWEIMCRMVGRDARNLRYIVSADIYNSETEALIAHSLQSTWTDDWKDTMCKRWEWKNKVEWDSSSEQFEVLLASPNGRGAAFMLIQHKSFYGEKRTIDKVTFWCTYTPDDDDEEEEGIWNLQLMFHVSQ